MATPTPDNHVLSSKVATPKVNISEPTGPAPSSDYPKVLYHTDSKPGALIGQQVATAEEEKALGSEWKPLAELNIETAPAEKSNGD